MIYVGSSVITRKCRECNQDFSFTLSLLTRKAKLNCPHCRSKIYSNFYINNSVLEISEEIKRKINFKDFNNRLN